jgi:hypothetical protein
LAIDNLIAVGERVKDDVEFRTWLVFRQDDDPDTPWVDMTDLPDGGSAMWNTYAEWERVADLGYPSTDWRHVCTVGTVFWEDSK